ncbi:hypothetical protein [Moorena sp. SIO4G3]|uniref:hypothetical protein n=1 Tax=Moorena sp. SIO4G3 TaxID=2607821 RepID=UPI00142C64E2|nr:hypothetical protein [Moorena sp. SIO4G3]NEO82090.1 hypothetical protein [Moorena sp. SIO4G3]
MNFAQGMYGIAIIYVLINKAVREAWPKALNAGLSAIKERKNQIFVLFRRGGASRVVNKACRVSEPLGGVGKKPTLKSFAERLCKSRVSVGVCHQAELIGLCSAHPTSRSLFPVPCSPLPLLLENQ